MWDHEADVVIVGYGGAGAAAAIVAADAGVKVVILEKSPEGGGNTKYSGGSIRTYLDLQKAVDFYETLCEGTTERDVVDAFVSESAKNPQWLAELGAKTGTRPESEEGGFPIKLPGAAFPHIQGADAIGPRVRVKGAARTGGKNLWGVLSQNVEARKIPVFYSTPVKHLSFDNSEGVTGVIALSASKEVTIRAKRGVILSCGGYEYEPSMHRNYLGQNFLSLGHPGNKGDGIRLAAELGADLWHMNAVAATFGYKISGLEFAIRHRMKYAGYVYIDQTGKRFMDETGIDGHAMWAPSSYIDMKTLEKPRLPSYLIFDEETRMRGPVGWTNSGIAMDKYEWSSDNSAEIQKGWIKSADNIAALASQINVPREFFRSTIVQYNSYCKEGSDPEFGRTASTLIPIAKAPFYAIELWPAIINTQGGPKRNARAQVLNVWGNPIKRLYSAGELGSLWHRNYPGGGNVSEALAFGRIAGRNVAAENPIG
jgi:succinate dehydrogenase/fumarate reductase flavoprotein subunit